MSPRSTRLLGAVLVLALASGMLIGCDAAEEPVTPEDEPAAEVPAAEEPGTADRPSVDEAEAAVLAIAREEYATIPIESATVYAMGQDAQGTWYVQAWTTAAPEFEGEQGEQWFVTWDGTSWTLIDYGTGLDVTDFPEVLDWQQP